MNIKTNINGSSGEGYALVEEIDTLLQERRARLTPGIMSEYYSLLRFLRTIHFVWGIVQIGTSFSIWAQPEIGVAKIIGDVQSLPIEVFSALGIVGGLVMVIRAILKRPLMTFSAVPLLTYWGFGAYTGLVNPAIPLAVTFSYGGLLSVTFTMILIRAPYRTRASLMPEKTSGE